MEMKRIVGFIFSVAGASLFVLLVCSPAISATVSDDFNSSSGINTTLWTALYTDGKTSISQTGGQLVMTQSANSYIPASGIYYEATLKFNFNIIGDYTAQVDYYLTSWPEDNATRMGIRTTGIAVERISDSSFITYAEGYLTDSLGRLQSVTTSDSSGKLMVKREGDTVSGFYFDSNFSEWKMIGSYYYSASQAGDALELSIWPWFNNKDVSIAFDNFSLVSVNPVPIPAAAWLLGTGLLSLAAIRRKLK